MAKYFKNLVDQTEDLSHWFFDRLGIEQSQSWLKLFRGFIGGIIFLWYLISEIEGGKVPTSFGWPRLEGFTDVGFFIIQTGVVGFMFCVILAILLVLSGVYSEEKGFIKEFLSAWFSGSIILVVSGVILSFLLSRFY